MSTTYGDRPLRVTFTSSDSSGVAEFFDGSETGAVGVRHNSTVAATATIASGETIGLFGDVTFTGTVTVAGEMVVV